MTDRATATFDFAAITEAPLKCAACANRACEALGSIPGVQKVDCNVAGSAVQVEYDPGRLSEADLGVEMERFGLELAEAVHHAAWRVTGLD